MEKIKKIVKDHFLSGLLILAPILIVLVVANWLLGGLTEWISEVPVQMMFEGRSSELVGVVRFFLVVGFLILGIILVSMLGFFSKLYFGQKALEWITEGLEKIPFFGAIYSSIDQLFKTLSSGSSKQFSRVVYIEYPRTGVWAVGFVTGPSKLKNIPEGYLNVFVPTVPNPTSGFLLLVKEDEIKESGLKVEEAFKLILSLGMAQPEKE